MAVVITITHDQSVTGQCGCDVRLPQAASAWAAWDQTLHQIWKRWFPTQTDFLEGTCGCGQL